MAGVLAAVVGLGGFSQVQAQSSGADNPVGVARAMSRAGVISSGGSYSAYTGSMSRTVPDLVVPGGVGVYPLVFSRTSTSRYVPGDDGDGGAFGPSGSWRHSYRWGFYRDNPGVTPAVIRIHYPDGGVIRFTSEPVSAPTTGGTVPPPDPYLRCVSPGVEERLENVSGNGDYILHRHDGGRVYFQKQSDATYHVAWIADPYNQTTNFGYYTSGPYTSKLQSITEPAGRSLQIGYAIFNGLPVISTVTASNTQFVTYNYSIVSPSTGALSTSGITALTSVSYNNDPDPANSNKPCQAIYNYQADNTGGEGRPLLYSCNDPHFPGGMTRIRYGFKQGAVPYGQIRAEIDDATGTTVSSYDQNSMTETRGDGPNSSYSFSSYLITNQQDYDGGQTASSYDPNSYLSSLTNRDGNVVTITREPYAGKRLAISRMDTNNQLLTTTFDYGSSADPDPYPVNPYWVMWITDPRGHKTTYTRNSNHQVIQINYPDNNNEYFSYNNFGQVISHQMIDGSVRTFTYDGSGNLMKSNDSLNVLNPIPANRYTVYNYDSIDRLNQVTDLNGHNTWFTYNGRHQLTQVMHDDKTHVDYTYDTYGNQNSVSNELTKVTTIAYDNHRRPISVTVPVNDGITINRTTKFSYEHGSATGDTHTQRGYGTMTLPSGKQMQCVYTGDGRLRSVTKGVGTADATTDAYTYNGDGEVLTIADANTIIQATYTYDVLDRKSTLTDANGHVTTWTYYPAGDPYAGWPKNIQSPGPTMGSMVTTKYTAYDTMGRLQTTQDPSGHITGKNYDGYGRLQTVSDANGGYTYGYDSLSRVVSLTFPDTTAEGWTYDPAGNVVTYKNRGASGSLQGANTKTIQYDDRNRPSGASWTNNAAPAQTWIYDAANHLTGVDNLSAALHYTYDDSGLPLSEQDTNYLANGVVNTTSYVRDADGNIGHLVYPAGDTPYYSYDNQNRCTGLNGSSQLSFQGEWVQSRTLGNGLTTQYHYQPNGRVDQVWHHRGGYDPSYSNFANTNISARLYGYAPDGQLTWGTHQPDGGASGSGLENGDGENYEYANNGSLTGFSVLYPNTVQTPDSHGDSTANSGNFVGGAGAGSPGSYVSSYIYDASGNRSQATQLSYQGGYGNIGYTANAEDQYASFGYDGNGCTTNGAVGWTYIYDAEGEMTSAQRQSDGYTLQFNYDGTGRLIGQGSNAGQTIFCYAGAQRIEERSVSNNASLYRYFFDVPGSDQICFRQTTAAQVAGSRLYYQYDLSGNSTHVSDDKGNILEQYIYDAYGTPYIYDKNGNFLGQTSPQDNRYLFHGSSSYEWLSASGLYYCRARMYLPVHGRFLQPDPIGLLGGDINLYRYCNDDPVDKIDPSGLKHLIWGLGTQVSVNAGLFTIVSSQTFVESSWSYPGNWPVYQVVTQTTGVQRNIGIGIQTVGTIGLVDSTNDLAGDTYGVGGENIKIGEGPAFGLSYGNMSPSDSALTTLSNNTTLSLSAGFGVSTNVLTMLNTGVSSTTVTPMGTLSNVTSNVATTAAQLLAIAAADAGKNAVDSLSQMIDGTPSTSQSNNGDNAAGDGGFSPGGGDSGGGGAGGDCDDDDSGYTGPDSNESGPAEGDGGAGANGGGVDPASIFGEENVT